MTPSTRDWLDSQFKLDGRPDVIVSGDLDYFEWSAVVNWNSKFALQTKRFDNAVDDCRLSNDQFSIIEVDELPEIKLWRTGISHGPTRFDFKLNFAGITIGLSKSLDCSRKRPSVYVVQKGRECLIHGAWAGHEMVHAMINALGGTVNDEWLSRGDICMDLPNLDPLELQDLVQQQHFITRASRAHPYIDLISQRRTGFYFGRNPIKLNCYDRRHKVLSDRKGDVIQAMIDRHWDGEIPKHATRVEIQLSRQWFRKKGIDSPHQFVKSAGLLASEICSSWFRITTTPVDRDNKHQSRAETHPLWLAINKGFADVYADGFNVPLQKIVTDEIDVKGLMRRACGLGKSALARAGRKADSFGEFLSVFSDYADNSYTDEEQAKFIEDLRYRVTESAA